MKGFDVGGSLNYFDWDPKRNLLYASGLGSLYRLKLQP
jgi:hypothetical protein